VKVLRIVGVVLGYALGLLAAFGVIGVASLILPQ
jgi:hypothetical protein